MYSKVVYDYFYSNSKKFKLKPNKLTRKNAFKKKATNKTVVVPTKSNTSTKIQKTSLPIENATQKKITSTVNVVYDTVQSIWKYAKSFISSQNSESSRFQERSSKKNKYRTSSRNNNLKSLRSISHDEKEKSCEPIKSTNEKFSTEHFPQEINDDIMKEETQQDEKVDEDFLTKTFTNLQELNAPLIKKVNFEIPERHSVSKEINLYSLDSDTEKLTSTNCDHITSHKTQNIKPYDKDTSCKISIKRNKPKNKTTEIYNKQQDLQNNNQGESDSCLNVEVQIFKSSMKTYGKGKRRNKKLHVHFKDEHDNEKRKYSSYKSKMLRQSDCCHPNAFFKKLTKNHMPEKKKSVNSGGKKRRLALCTKSSKPAFKKKRSKRNSSSNLSLQSKSSDYFENKAGKKACKTPKKYSVYATTKIHKKKRAKICKKATANDKSTNALQDIIKSDTKFDEPVNLSQNDTNKVMKGITIGDELCSCKQKHLQ